MLHGIAAAVKALKALLIVLAASALMLLILSSILPKMPKSPDSMRLNEVLLNPAEAGWDDGFVELYNAGEEAVNVDGWSVHTQSGSNRLFGEVKPGEYRVIYGDVASPTAEDVVVKDSAGRIVDSYNSADRPPGASVGRLPDGYGRWSGFVEPTPGAPNTAAEYAQPTLTTLPEVAPPACMVKEFEDQSDNMRELGFSGGVGDFCKAFEQEMMDADPYVRRRIAEIEDPVVRADIAYCVAERRAARDREERIVNLIVSDLELLDSIRGLLGEELFSLGLDGELAAMNARFKRMMFDVLLNGTNAERRELRLQLRFYLESRDSGGTKTLVFNPDEVRVMLSGGDSVQEILIKLGV
jgi:hypothetical protein